MPQSLDRILVHFVFSTKNRAPFIADVVRDDLHGYIGGIVENLSGRLLKAGSVEDHIHLLVAHSRTYSPAKMVEAIKTGSSKWIKTKLPDAADFHWQSGYGAFSISPSHRTMLESYLSGQREHHRTTTFQEEYRQLLKKYGIVFRPFRALCLSLRFPGRCPGLSPSRPVRAETSCPQCGRSRQDACEPHAGCVRSS